jgi:uncharacterized protein YegL
VDKEIDVGEDMIQPTIITQVINNPVIQKTEHPLIKKGVPAGTNGLHIIIVLDESGSMSSKRLEVIDNMNSFIERQKALPDRAHVSLIKLGSAKAGGGVEDVWEYKDLKDVQPLTESDYNPHGFTPLLDAIGRAVEIADISQTNKQLSERDGILLLIITDGGENSSQKFKDNSVIKSIVENRQENNWLISYIGADIDAFSEATNYGFNAGTTLQTSKSALGGTFNMLAEKTRSLRSSYTSHAAAFADTGAQSGATKELNEIFNYTDEDRKQAND